jgi:hypothetical protein
VFSFSRHSRTEADLPELPVTLVVITIDADCPAFTEPGSQEGVSELMAVPFGSTHGGLPTTLALVTLVITRSSGADPGPLLVSVNTNVSVWPGWTILIAPATVPRTVNVGVVAADDAVAAAPVVVTAIRTASTADPRIATIGRIFLLKKCIPNAPFVGLSPPTHGDHHIVAPASPA